MKKLLKILALILVIATFCLACWLINGFVGNPVSKMLATYTARAYLTDNLADTDYEIDEISFNFKFVCYQAYFTSESSPDSSFTLMLGMDGKIFDNYYEEQVTNRGNTARRLEDAYRIAVDRVLDDPQLPYNCHIGFGDLQFISKKFKDAPDVPSYALITNDLELDGIYDINELGAKAGKITLHIYDDAVSVEYLSQIILDMKDIFDNADVSFYAIDCVLESPKETESDAQLRLEVMDFLYGDIYQEGITERVRASNDAAVRYYEEMDAIKDQEIKSAS